jgi:predicted RNase H-like HicB family nuclease
MAEIVDLGLVEFGETPQDALNNLEMLFYVKVDDIQQELRSKYENVRAEDLM